MAKRRAAAGRLIIMVKEPKFGSVKTRLAAQIGASAAVSFYRTASALLIRRLAGDPRWETVLAVAPPLALGSRCWPGAIPRIPQGGGDIGIRMERLLRSQGHRLAVLIGSDIPGVEASHIGEAFALLARNDAVFGPAEDGGFWLVGLKPLPRVPAIFRDVRWSTRFALSDTLANLADRKIGFAARLSDVDNEEDYRRTGASALRLLPRKNKALYSSS